MQRATVRVMGFGMLNIENKLQSRKKTFYIYFLSLYAGLELPACRLPAYPNGGILYSHVCEYTDIRLILIVLK